MTKDNQRAAFEKWLECPSCPLDINDFNGKDFDVAYQSWQAARPQWRGIDTVPKNKVVIMFDAILKVATVNMAHEDGSTLKMPLDGYSHWMLLPEPPTTGD